MIPTISLVWGQLLPKLGDFAGAAYFTLLHYSSDSKIIIVNKRKCYVQHHICEWERARANGDVVVWHLSK